MGGRGSKEEPKTAESPAASSSTKRPPSPPSPLSPKEANTGERTEPKTLSNEFASARGSNSDESPTRTRVLDEGFAEFLRRRDEEEREEGRKFSKSVIENPKRAGMLVAAMDFGTTYSGFAFSFKSNQEKIETNVWHGALTRQKTPTVLLLKPDQTIHSFGDEALAKYATLTANEKQSWYMFERFKMQLYNKDRQLLAMDVKVKDFTGKELPAIDVFTKAITCLKSYLEKALDKCGTLIRPGSDIHWVLTVPTIWDDLAKHFMREAARRSGIPDEMLTLALEPEAASVWCLKEFGVGELPIGCKYTLLDLGGGTGDITIHERQLGGSLKELLPPVGGAFGGNEVNKKFLGHLTATFGNRVLQTLKSKHPSQYRELLDEFERKKKTFNGSADIKITLPLQLRELFEESVGESLEESMRNCRFEEQVALKNDKLELSKDLVLNFFSEVVKGIVEKLESVEEQVETDYIILAGGFSSSPYIQKEITKHFGNKLKIPKDPELVIVNGAVLYGHSPAKIASRRSKYTYGIARMMKFKAHHNPQKKVTVDRVDYVDDLFCKHIEIGEEVKIEDAEKAEAHEYFPPGTDVKQVVLPVYASDKKETMYVTDDGCVMVGLIKLDIDPKGDIFSKILVKMIFGGTELVIEATDEKNHTVVRQSIDFLG